MIYPKPYSIYLGGTIMFGWFQGFRVSALGGLGFGVLRVRHQLRL